ncbi:AAA family ATPase [Rothia sp. AR01]|uniref:Nuclease SbcCD subunit C n=1 Tax=Rothia santali TaxID=2949643 RepID=A0A9X2HAT1_9MICC|nr:AAA family ATPase [Rothia santali]MCP3426224.1 AAA family ATPase [Rothia santali]
MRLHRLSMTAFGPYPGREEIDFEPLNEAGLFLLTGPTGAGKSTVFDAVCFALYGSTTSPENSKGLKSAFAGEAVRPVVELELTVGTERYLVARTPAWRRPSRRARAGWVSEEAQVSLSRRGQDGAWEVVATRNDEAGQHLQERIGLNREQFSQVVMLPQGRFAQFLAASSSEREGILRRLFPTSLYGTVQEVLRERAQRAEEELSRGEDGAARAEQALADALRRQGLDAPEAGPRGAVRAGARAGRGRAGPRPRAARERAEVAAVARRRAEDAHRAVAEWEEHRRLADRARALERSAEGRRRDRTLLAAAEAAEPVLAAAERARGTGRRSPPAAASLRGGAARRRAAGPPHLGEPPRRGGGGAGGAFWAAETEAPVTGAFETGTPVTGTPETGASGTGAPVPDEGRPGPPPPPTWRTWPSARRLAEAARRLREAEDADAAAAALEEEAAAPREARRAAGHQERTEAARTEAESARRELEHRVEAGAQAPAREAEARRPWRPPARWPPSSGESRPWGRGRAGRAASSGAVRRARAAPGRALRPGGLDPGRAPRLRPAVPRVRGPGAPAPGPRRARRRDHGGGRPGVGGAARDGGGLRARGPGPARRGREPRGVPARGRGLGGPGRGRAARGTGAARLEEHERARAERPRRVEELAQLDAALERHREGRRTAELAAETARTRHAQARERAETLRSALGETPSAAELAERERAVAELDRAAHRVLLLRDRAEALRQRSASDAAELAALIGGSRFDDEESARAAALPAADAEALRERIRREEEEAARVDESWNAPAHRRLLERIERGEEEPEASGLRELRERAEAAEAALEEVVAELARLESLHAWLAAQERAVGAEAERTTALRERAASLRDLADVAAGNGSENRLKMSLTTYVLAAQLEEIAAAASVRLHQMTSGRYTVRHTDAAARHGARSGLGLEVFDAWTSEARPASSLSGGETFMASLCLALGTADVVQGRAGGIEIDTLFVDEGFGTLDEATLEQVMDALEALREHGRVIGVISHVADMRSRVPQQVRISRSPSGSTIEVSES